MLENLKDKLESVAKDPKVQQTVAKAAGITEEGMEKLNDAKDKVEDFVSEKTGGKGILGFGKKKA